MKFSDIGIRNVVLSFDTNELESFEIVQGDTGTRGLRVRVTNPQGEVLKANSKYSLRLLGVNSNYPSKSFYTEGVIEDDYWVVTISTDMASKPGKLQLQLALYEGSSKLIQSNTFDVEVTKSLGNGGELGENLVVDFTKLKEAIERTEELKREYEASLQEQANLSQDVTAKHREVTTMHSNLQNVFDTENARVQAEEQRTSAEDERKRAETERKESETARKEAESTRASKESARVQAEEQRTSAESTRASKESERQTAEAERIKKENERIEAEKLRVAGYAKAKTVLDKVSENPIADLTNIIDKHYKNAELSGKTLKLTKEDDTKTEIELPFFSKNYDDLENKPDLTKYVDAVEWDTSKNQLKITKNGKSTYVTVPNVSTSKDGFMAKEDKKKLDNCIKSIVVANGTEDFSSYDNDTLIFVRAD